MKTIVTKGPAAILLAAAILAAAGRAGAQAPAPPETAVCGVCRVHSGETAPEPVAASSEYEGVTYYFCAEECKRRFDADPASYVPPLLPRPAPEFALHALDGSEISLAGLRGRTVLLDFWATWCKPCVETMPALQRLHDEYAARGLTVVGVSIDEGKPGKTLDKVRRFAEKRRVSYPIALDRSEGAAWEAYAVRVVPAAFLIDPEGRIVAQWSGKTAEGVIEEEVRRRLAP